MPDISAFHREFVFIHVVGVFAFLMAHGVSAGVMFRLRSQRDPASVRALVSLSSASLGVTFAAALVVLVSGIVAGFSGDYWVTGTFWVWASLAVFLAVAVAMGFVAREPLDRVRRALGDGAGDVDATALDAAIESGRPMLVSALGAGAVVVLTWLMMYKPF